MVNLFTFAKKTELMETIIIQAETKKAKAIKQFLKAFGVAFKVKETEESPYNPEFVEKILATKDENSTRINPDNIWESIL
jgi:G:T-mismatch repair DNA endonuclease (very short patch repair protein)